jgi:hypothetical protein
VLGAGGTGALQTSQGEALTQKARLDVFNGKSKGAGVVTQVNPNNTDREETSSEEGHERKRPCLLAG